jgi:RimJ/RimL family protein N-acetyltransferase
MISLRELESGDVDWVYEACQDAEIQRWTLVPSPYTRADAEWFVRENAEYLCRAIIDSESSRPVGMIGVHGLHDGVADIGYWVAPWGRGHGAAAGAVRELTGLLAAMHPVREVTARVAVTNIASRTTIERAGFTEHSRESSACPDGGEKADAVVYRLVIDGR